jgi:hypothetical protein
VLGQHPGGLEDAIRLIGTLGYDTLTLAEQVRKIALIDHPVCRQIVLNGEFDAPIRVLDHRAHGHETTKLDRLARLGLGFGRLRRGIEERDRVPHAPERQSGGQRHHGRDDR